MNVALLAQAGAAHDGHGYLVLAGLVVAYLVGYWISLVVHPYTACRRCDGRGRRRGGVFTHSYRLCPHCGGSGDQPRLGTRLFFGDPD